MRTLRLTKDSAVNILNDLLKRSPNNYEGYSERVDAIIRDVKTRGDAAVFEYTKQFDKADLCAQNIRVTDAEIKEAYGQVDAKLLEVIRRSMRISGFTMKSSVSMAGLIQQPMAPYWGRR